MEALRTSYGESSCDSNSEPEPTAASDRPFYPSVSPNLLCLFSIRLIHWVHLITQCKSIDPIESVASPTSRATSLCMFTSQRKEITLFLKRVVRLVPELHVVDVDIPLRDLIKEEQKFEQVVLGREFHVSLGRTVPIRIHQRDSMVGMLRQRFQSHRRYWIDFTKWVVFVNDDYTRTFLSLEVTAGGLSEIKKQIEAVNDVYRLHNLPQFYKDPRPHVSMAWAIGDISDSLWKVIGEETKTHNTIGDLSRKRLCACVFSGISCKIGKKTFDICKVPEE